MQIQLTHKAIVLMSGFKLHKYGRDEAPQWHWSGSDCGSKLSFETEAAAAHDCCLMNGLVREGWDG